MDECTATLKKLTARIAYCMPPEHLQKCQSPLKVAGLAHYLAILWPHTGLKAYSDILWYVETAYLCTYKVLRP